MRIYHGLRNYTGTYGLMKVFLGVFLLLSIPFRSQKALWFSYTPCHHMHFLQHVIKQCGVIVHCVSSSSRMLGANF